jgi:hypothetical protein
VKPARYFGFGILLCLGEGHHPGVIDFAGGPVLAFGECFLERNEAPTIADHAGPAIPNVNLDPGTWREAWAVEAELDGVLEETRWSAARNKP